MQAKLNMLKRQIDKISRKEAKASKSKGSIKTKYHHGRNLSSYSFHKYQSLNQGQGPTTSYTAQTNAPKKKHGSKAHSKKKSNKGHVKSNSFASMNKPANLNKYHHSRGQSRHLNEETGGRGHGKAQQHQKKYQEYDSLLKKTSPVNIFNIRNYNMLKHEKHKWPGGAGHEDQSLIRRNESVKLKAKKGSPSAGGSNSSNQKVHNFFVFIGNKEAGGATSKNSKQLQKMKEGSSPGAKNYFSSDYNNKKRSYKKDKKYVKLANLMKRQPIREKARKMSAQERGSVNQKRGNSSNPGGGSGGSGGGVPAFGAHSGAFYSSELSSFHENIENFTKELRAMRGETAKADASNNKLETEKSLLTGSNFTERSDKTLKIRNSVGGTKRSLGMFGKTKKKTLDVLNQLEKTVRMIKSIKPEMRSTQTQTLGSAARKPRVSTRPSIGGRYSLVAGERDDLPQKNSKTSKNSKNSLEPKSDSEPESEFKPISFSNLNIMNLLKEVAKEILVKSQVVNPKIKNLNEFCKQINAQISEKRPESKDPEKQVLITSILNYYQEQIIFEEALAILQEKKVDLENLFVYAYERLKIKVDDEESKKDGGSELDSQRSFTVVTDASLASASDFGLQAGEGGDLVELEHGFEHFKKKEAAVNQFELDFDNLVREEISEDEDDSEAQCY